VPEDQPRPELLLDREEIELASQAAAVASLGFPPPAEPRVKSAILTAVIETALIRIPSFTTEEAEAAAVHDVNSPAIAVRRSTR
jgi:hypothetical protein